MFKLSKSNKDSWKLEKGEYIHEVYVLGDDNLANFVHNSKSFQLDQNFDQNPFEYLKEDKQKCLTDESRFTRKVLFGCLAAFFTTSLPAGFNMGVVNTPEDVFKGFFNESLNSNRVDIMTKQQIEFLWSIAVSLLVIGALITSVFAGYLANLLGRRQLILFNSFLGLTGVALCWLSKYINSVPLFLAGRLISGFQTGFASSIVPMYLIEISPKRFAGHFGILHVMGLNGGIFIAQLLGLHSILGSANKWPLLYFVNAVFIMIGQIFLLFSPESPIYLYLFKKDENKAIQVLQEIRQQTLFELNDEINCWKQEKKNSECNSVSFWQLVKQKHFRKCLLIVCMLHAGQQLIGINAIFYYSTMTFKSVGLSHLQSQYGSIGCALLNTICALYAFRLMSKYTPRKLFLISSIGTTLSLFALTITMTFNNLLNFLNYGTIVAILAYVTMFAIGQGPIPFMFGGELFDKSSLAVGLSAGGFTNWACNVVVAIAFPILTLYIHQYVFIIFLIFDALLIVFVMFCVPETRKH